MSTSPSMPGWSRRRVVTSLAVLSGAGLVTACQSEPASSPDGSISSQSSQLSSSSDSPLISLNGAGASFPAILYQRWFTDYNRQNAQTFVNYQSVGSAAGIQQVIDGTVDFGASDIAMSDDEIAQVERGVVLVPMTAGSVVVAYNVPGVPTGLKLSRQVLVAIFLGSITQWNDPALADLNPELTLPELEIVVVHRADGSGTTATFTRYLDAVSAQWSEGVGSGVSVNWPTGAGAKGNEGVSAQVQLVEGVIAYVEAVFATELGLSVAALENQAGAFIVPTPDSASVTLSEVELPDNLRAFIADPIGEDAYPIVTYTWILAYQSYEDPAKAATLKTVLIWALTEGQQISAELGYLPLPSDVTERAIAAVETINA